MKRTKTYKAAAINYALCFMHCALIMACSTDSDLQSNGKYPLELTAATISTAQSRATVDDTWTKGDEVGVSVNDGTTTSTYTYSVADAATGKLTSSAPYYWQDFNDITVTAWYPATASTDGTTFTHHVNQDQSGDGYAQSDYLKTEATTVSFNGNEQLTFTHQVAKVVVTLTAGSGMTDNELANATINIYDGTQYIQSHDGSALIMPTTITSGTAFIKATIGGIDYTYVLTDQTTFAASNIYKYDIEVSKSGMKLKGCTIGGWTDNEFNGDAYTSGTANVETAGSLTSEMLEAAIEDGDGYVTITGTINQDDLNKIIAKAQSYVSLDMSKTNGEDLKIEDAAFQQCTSLESVTIGNGVTSIGEASFFGCTSLVSITIPSSVTLIGNSAFDGCTSLKSVTIGNGVTSIGYNAFKECTSLISVTIPSSVSSMEYNVFQSCTALTSVIIENGVTSIGTASFLGCTSLNSITIPSSVTSIGANAFDGCTSLVSVTIPSSVTEIKDNAFKDCSSLTSITSEAKIPPTCVGNSFPYIDNLLIYVPSESVETYKSQWSDYANYITAITTE